MHKICQRIVQDNLVKIKQHIEFQIEPDLTESNTSKLLSSHLKSTKTKLLILHFNKDKIKLRTPKNATIDKEQYNDSMKIILSAINPNRFSFKFSSTKKYVFLTKTPLERDNIAILLRCYIERLKRTNNNFLCEFYLRLNHERLNKNVGSNDNTLTRDQLVSKILAPISSNPNFKNLSLSSSKMAISPQSITALLAAPITNNTNNAEPSSANDESAEFDVDAIFPDFNKD